MATQFQLRRRLSARPSLVWEWLTSERAITQWFWPEQTFGTTAQIDLRAGGSYPIAGPRAGIAVSGQYISVDSPRRLVCSWRWDGDDRESLVTLDLVANEATTDLVLTHERLADDTDCKNQAKGWSDCLDRLPAWLASAGLSADA